jgi:hypothetical protein
MTENGASLIAPVPRAPVASLEELSDMSQSSSSGEFTENTLKEEHGNAHVLVADTSRLDEALATLGKLGSSLPSSEPNSTENTLHETPSSGDSGVLQDSNGSDSDSGDGANRRGSKGDGQRVMTSSMSAEKIGGSSSTETTNRPLVRTSKSHENYLQSEGGEMSLVAIDIEDNMAYSLDTLNYHDSNSDSSNEKVSENQHLRSVGNTPEKRPLRATENGTTAGDTEREFVPGFISLQSDSRSNRPRLKDVGRSQELEDEETDTFPENGSDLSPGSENGYGEGEGDIMQLSVRSDDSDADSLYHQPSKGVDQPSAARLAKRLYNLEGFRKSDVSRHLSKK